jgi:hypothetical protein
MNYAVWIMGSHLNLDIFNIQNPDHHVLIGLVRCYPVCSVNLCLSYRSQKMLKALCTISYVYFFWESREFPCNVCNLFGQIPHFSATRHVPKYRYGWNRKVYGYSILRSIVTKVPVPREYLGR